MGAYRFECNPEIQTYFGERGGQGYNCLKIFFQMAVAGNFFLVGKVMHPSQLGSVSPFWVSFVRKCVWHDLNYLNWLGRIFCEVSEDGLF